MFLALLQQQQDNFKGFIKIIIDFTNTRLDAITREVQEIKACIQFTQKEVDDIKTNNASQSVRGDSMQTDIMKICDSLLVVTDKIEYLERQSRKNNLVFDGITEEPGETWYDTERKVKDILVERLKLHWDMNKHIVLADWLQVAADPNPLWLSFQDLRIDQLF